MINGFILPLSLAVMLIAARKLKYSKDYDHPKALYIFGIAVVVATLWMGASALSALVR